MGNRSDILDRIDDLEYYTLWGVEVGRDGSLSRLKLSHTLHVPAGFKEVDFTPSATYEARARQFIEGMDWAYQEDEDGTPREQVAVCYVFKSKPDEPVCTNNLER